MSAHKSTGKAIGPLRWWFYLTRDERKLVLTILTLALLGMTARYIYLKQQEPESASVEVFQR